MKLHMTGDIAPIKTGLDILASELNITITDEGYPVHVTQRQSPITIKNENKANAHGEITYDQPIHFFRALGLWLENYHKPPALDITEEPQRTKNDVILDQPRKAVTTIQGSTLAHTTI